MAQAKSSSSYTPDMMKKELAKLSKQQTEEMKQKFKLFDEDGSGSIDAGELLKGFKRLNQHFTVQELKGLISEFDVDGNGEIDFNEFCLIMSPSVLENFRLKMKFKEIDADNSGEIDQDELRKALENMNLEVDEKEFKEIWKKADADNSGAVDFGEFKDLIQELEDFKIKKSFEQADKDGGGTIDKDELKALLKDLGVYLPDDKIDGLVKKVDADGNGEIDIDEFKVLMKEIDNLLRADFCKVDRDNSGLIDKDETKRMLENLNIELSKKALDDLFKLVDKDGNGELDFDEYKVLLRKLYSNKKDMKICNVKYLVKSIDEKNSGLLNCLDGDYNVVDIRFDTKDKVGKDIIGKFPESVKSKKDFYVKVEEVKYVFSNGSKQTISRKVVALA